MLLFPSLTCNRYSSLRLAFCLFKYFPYGGLQRDFLRIARLLRDRGHDIHVYTMRWEGNEEPGFHLHLIKVKAWQNHARILAFATKVKPLLAAEQFDLVIGFNKMPYLDIYYAADVCYQARMRQKHSAFYRLTPRYRQYAAFEEAVFQNGKKSEILLISPGQETAYRDCYQIEPARFHLLPPGIAKDRMAPPNAPELRAQFRRAHGLADDQKLLLMVGSGFKTKGVDRSIKALAALPDALKAKTRLFVLGQDDPAHFQKVAARLNVLDQVSFLGGRPDVLNFMLAADLLLQPSYHENTGTAILEALVAGLPVLTVAVCGYAHYVTDAGAGMVIPEPFSQADMNHSLEKMLLSPADEWREHALTFAKTADIYSLPVKAADFIEQCGQKRVSTP
jgi:UDP-glucose:(heptosyl)LPS alpha-1,3-glucosyltransferase